jgi:CDP-diacylglycerol---glycerol-3-phosphate 3-phosphatidyltransferase
MVPVFVAFLSFESLAFHIVAYVVFVAATLTDYYDGKIARERNLVTNFGKLFDPIADKVLLAAALIMLTKLDVLYIPGWTVIAILGREFLISGARSLAASEGLVIPANKWGKTKAVLQMVYIFVFLGFVIIGQFVVLSGHDAAAQEFHRILRPASCWAIAFVALYTVYSGVQFARVNWHVLKLGNTS